MTEKTSPLKEFSEVLDSLVYESRDKRNFHLEHDGPRSNLTVDWDTRYKSLRDVQDRFYHYFPQLKSTEGVRK